MKKVKVKTKQKQKQKQSQTVNINLGELLKKSKPRRKTQPKPQPNISQPITFNAPPIREYIDTSLYNTPSRTENPLLLRTTTTPIPDTPITINQIPANTVGQIQNQYPLFQKPSEPQSIIDQVIQEPPSKSSVLVNDIRQNLNKSGLPSKEIKQNLDFYKWEIENYYKNVDIANEKQREQDKFNKQQDLLKKIELKNIQKANKKPTKKQEKERKKQEELSKPKIDIGPSIALSRPESSSSLIQSNISSFFNNPKPIDEKKNAYINAASPRQQNALISEQEKSGSITSEQNKPLGILDVPEQEVKQTKKKKKFIIKS